MSPSWGSIKRPFLDRMICQTPTGAVILGCLYLNQAKLSSLGHCPLSELLHLRLSHGRASNPRHAALMRSSAAIGTGVPRRLAVTAGEAIAAQGAAGETRHVHAER